jgi:hypothetical protein
VPVRSPSPSWRRSASPACWCPFRTRSTIIRRSTPGFLSQAGAALLLPQAELTPAAIGDLCTYSRSRLQEMAERARELAKPEATAELARMCEELAQ